MAIRTSNPALNANAFTGLSVSTTNAMTVDGTVNKTALLLGALLLPALFVWYQFSQGATRIIMPCVWGGIIGGLVLALVTIAKKEWAPMTAPLYALFEGLFIGAISSVLQVRFPGIVIQAVVLTFGTLAVMLVCYRMGIIRATEKFRAGVVAATGAICLVYVISLVLRLFGLSVPFIHSSGLIGIGFSLFVVTIAALNLVLDFDFIERGAAAGAPKYMEWYGAFGLLVTLVWLYIEILRLLSKLRRR